MISEENYINGLTAFNFRVSFNGLDGIKDFDSGFQSISGIKAVLESDDTGILLEDGVKVNTKFGPVVLKRGVTDPGRSVLLQWVLRCLNESVYDPIPEMFVEILNDEQNSQLIIKLGEVSVRSWSLGELNTAKSELLIEELVLDYESIEIIPCK